MPEKYDADLANLVDWLDLASSVLSDKIDKTPPAELKKHQLYNDIVRCIREIEKHGFIVLSGVMNAPQERLPDWKVAVISVTPKLSDPGALKRKHFFVDRRTVRFNHPFRDIFAHELSEAENSMAVLELFTELQDNQNYPGRMP